MKTAGRENPNHGVAWPHNRAHGAVGQNRSYSIQWAAKQEKFQPKGMCFFLTSTFIERSREVSRRGLSRREGIWVTMFRRISRTSIFPVSTVKNANQHGACANVSSFSTKVMSLNLRTAKVSGTARNAPAGPRRKLQITSESMISRNEICSPFFISMGLIT